MKKSLIALAALASFAGLASAQSSVTLFGIVDATLAHGHGNVSNKTALANSGYNSSQLGFRGTEDLGGGMAASFWLEAAVNNDNGTGGSSNTNNQFSGAPTSAASGGTGGVAATGGQGLTFARRSTVSLSGGWGELRLGRDYTPQFRNLSAFDPFGTNGVGTNQLLNSISSATPGGLNIITAVRASNSFGYFLPGNIGGFYGEFKYYLGENNSGAATSKDGRGAAARVGYANGPINVSLALSRTEYATGDHHQNNLGGSYDFGMAKLMGVYARDKVGATEGKGYLIGTSVPVGPGEVKLSYARYRTDALTTPTTKKLALGYVHNLSKRTALYTTFARVANTGAAAQSLNGAGVTAGEKSTGYDFGVRHSF